MQKKWFFIILNILPGIFFAADNQIPLYVTLPVEQSSASGLSVIEKININTIHRGDTKTLKQLSNESYENNQPSLPIVAYWYRSGERTGRAYASYKAFKRLRNALTILAQSFYNITFNPSQGYLITPCNEPDLDYKNY